MCASLADLPGLARPMDAGYNDEENQKACWDLWLTDYNPLWHEEAFRGDPLTNWSKTLSELEEAEGQNKQRKGLCSSAGDDTPTLEAARRTTYSSRKQALNPDRPDYEAKTYEELHPRRHARSHLLAASHDCNKAGRPRPRPKPPWRPRRRGSFGRQEWP